EPAVHNYRLFLDARKSLRSAPPVSNRPALPQITSLTVTQLDTPPEHAIQPFQRYEQWLSLLTQKQKHFVLTELRTPHRIEGPAGTGKTLCLILKAIAGLRAAENDGKEHKALFITHSEATRRTIDQLIQVVDSKGYIEGSSYLKAQYLKLSTLQQL